MANPSVSVSLVNDQGIIISKNLSDSSLANSMFRVLFTKNAVTKSVWKLKIENTSDAEQLFASFSWSTRNGSSNNKITGE